MYDNRREGSSILRKGRDCDAVTKRCHKMAILGMGKSGIATRIAVVLILCCCSLRVAVANSRRRSFLLSRSSTTPLTVISWNNILELRGGSSAPYQSRTPPSVVRPGQSSSNRRKISATSGMEGMEDEVDTESETSTREAIDSFLTRDSRNSFIARVYSILAFQLIVTAISCFLFGLNPMLSNISQLSRNGQPSPLAAIPMAGMVASTIAWFRVCSSPDARRKSPNKWWWLGIFTAGEALSVGFISSFYKFRAVVTAMGATALATSAVSLYTIKQKNPNRDLSQIGASLASWSMILLTYLSVGILQKTGVLPGNFLPFSNMLYSGFAACLFSAFLAYHTKLIVAGKHSKYRMNEKDFVLGAMALYTDIVDIFLAILQMMGDDKRRD